MDVLIKAVAGGVSVAITVIIGKMLGPKYGGIMTMFPVLFYTNYLIFTAETKAPETIQLFLKGLGVGVIIFLIMALFLYFLSHSPGHYWRNLLLSLLLWIGLAVAYFQLS